MLAVPAPGQSLPLERGAWESVEAILQTQGPRAALPASRRALAASPDSRALLGQHWSIRLALDGPGVMDASLDSLRALSPHRAAVGELSLHLERGPLSAAADALARIPPPRPTSLDPLMLLLDEVILEVLQRGPAGAARTDSLLTLITTLPSRGPSDGFLATWVEASVRQIRAASLIVQGHHDEGIAALAEAAATARAQSLRRWVLRADFSQGRTLCELSRFADAVPVLMDAAALAGDLGERWLETSARGWLGYALEEQGLYRRALPHRRFAVRVCRQTGGPVALIRNLMGLGWCAIRTGLHQEAEATLTEAIELGREIGWTWGEIQALNNRGVLYMDQEQPSKAMETFEQALSRLTDAPNDSQRAMILNNVAILHFDAHRDDLAIPIYRELLQIHRDAGDGHAESTVLNNLGLATEAIGETREATVLFRECAQRARALGDVDVSCLTNLGRRLSLDGRHAEGEACLQEALVAARSSGDPGAVAAAREQLGRCLSFQMRLGEARSHAAAADSLRARRGEKRGRIPGLIRLARIQRGLGQLDQAEAALLKAEEVADAFPFVVAFARGERALLAIAANRGDEAIELAKDALRRSRDGVGLSREARYFRYAAVFVAVQAILSSLDDAPPASRAELTDLAFDGLLRVKSRSLVEFVAASQRQIEPDISDALRDRAAQVRRNVDRLMEELETASAGRADSVRVRLAEARVEQETVRQSIFAADTRYERVATAPTPRPEEIVEELAGPGTLVLDYLLPGDCEELTECPTVLFAIDDDGITLHDLGSGRLVQRQVALLEDLLTSPGSEDRTASIDAMLTRLGGRLLGPVQERIGRADHVIVSPNWTLNRIPFAALRVPADGVGTRYLVEHASVSTVPSLALLHQLRRAPPTRPTPTWDMAIWRAPVDPEASSSEDRGPDFLSPLTHADQELNLLLGHFARSVAMPTDLDAQLDLGPQLAGLGVLGRSRVLHFIAHGMFDAAQPWRSGLYLRAPSPGTPAAKLEIADVYSLDFRCDLVTLAACETARARAKMESGMLGFSQALLASGAQAVLSSLWSIDDASTPQFMRGFYDALATGASKADALRQAQLEFIEDPRLRHPRHWAPFVIIGDGASGVALTRRRERTLPPGTTLALGITLLLTAVWLLRRSVRGA